MARLFDDASSEYATSSTTPVAGLPLTLACWFNSDNITDAQALMGIEVAGATGTRIRLAILGQSGDVLSAQKKEGESATVSANSTSSYSADTWHHAALTSSGATDLTVYLDGGNSASNSTSSNPSSMDGIWVGATESTGTLIQYLSGSLAEIGIWNVALTASEIASLSDGVSPLKIRPQSLQCYWPMIGKNSPESDVVGGYDLTLSGTASSEHARVYYHVKPQSIAFVPVAVGKSRFNPLGGPLGGPLEGVI